MLKNKKILKSLAGLSIATVLLSGCGNEKEKENANSTDNFNETGYPIVEEKINLEMMGKRSPLQPEWEEMGFFKEMEEKTNISFDFRTPGDEQFETQKQLAFSSMELPDLFFGGELSASELVDFGNQGLLIPLEDLIEDYAPNFKKLMEKYPELEASLTAPDGHIYSLPAIEGQITSNVPLLWGNGHWLDEINLDEKPDTIDDFKDMLIKFKESDPNQNGENDEIPLSASSLSELRYNFMPAFGIPYSVDTQLGLYEKNGEAKYSFIQDEYKYYLEFLGELYEEELLDQEIISHTWEQYIGKGADNQIGIFPVTWPIVMMGYSDPAEGVNYPLMPALTSEHNPTKIVPESTFIKNGRAAITSENEHPEATMRWLDYLYTEEGTILARLGIEGVSYEWNEDKTEWNLLEREDMSTTQSVSQEAVASGTSVPVVLEQEFFDKEDNPTMDIINDWGKEEYEPHTVTAFPDVFYTLEEQERLNEIAPDIESYIDQKEAQFVTKELSLEEDWDDFVKTLKKLGADEAVEIAQAAYDRWEDVQE